MNTHHDILRELEAYAEAADTDPKAVCRKATGNPRLHDRLIRRIERLETDISALRDFMASNPPADASQRGGWMMPMVSCLSQDVGTPARNIKGRVA
jgi:hypothetical protein